MVDSMLGNNGSHNDDNIARKMASRCAVTKLTVEKQTTSRVQAHGDPDCGNLH